MAKKDVDNDLKTILLCTLASKKVGIIVVII
jgi:hypothetical protein